MDEEQIRQFHLKVEAGHGRVPVARLLAEHAGLPVARVKDAMHKGAAWLTHGRQTRRIRRQSSVPAPGDELHLYFNPQVLQEEPLAAALLADEGGFSVWDKPAGMRSQGSKWGDHTTVTRWAESHLQPERPAYLVHRLDRAASGLILLAHSKRMSRELSALFAAREIEKVYRVGVHGKFPVRPAERLVDAPIDGREARSRVQREAFDPDAKQSLLRVLIETGRKHQVRRHLAGLGFPVVGDRLYGNGDQTGDLQLRAVSLVFAHPQTGERVRYDVAGD